MNIHLVKGDAAMVEVEQTRARGVDGRFVPGRSGNPAGRRKGTRNRATLLREAIDELIREALRARRGAEPPAFRLHNGGEQGWTRIGAVRTPSPRPDPPERWSKGPHAGEGGLPRISCIPGPSTSAQEGR